MHERAPLLTLITDGSSRDLTALARAAAREGIDYFQVREKSARDRDLLGQVRAVVSEARGSALKVLVNGRPDIASIGGAHGVELPEEGLLVEDVKRAFPALLVGASRHSLEGARRAEDEGADFVMLGPIFKTPGKEERPLGLEALSEVARALSIPVHAVGGIDAVSGPEAWRAGARGLAAIRFFRDSPLEEAVHKLRGPG